jgi:hypothetical protein
MSKMLQPGEEETYCAVFAVGNTAPADVAQFDATLIAGTHHMILYATDEPVAETPRRCNPFSGVIPGFGTSNGMSKPLTITQSPHEVMTMPPGVSYQLAANQNMRVEIHFINASTAPQMGSGKVDIRSYRGTPEHRADLLFAGNVNINIPPGAMTTIGGITDFQPNDKVFSFTGHTHRMGTRFTIERIDAAGAPMQMLYDNPDWEHPPLTQFTPPLDFSDGSRLHYTCSYHNTTDQTLRLGESFYDEMCFYWAYYYPSRGFLFIPSF